jgi:hypothetical protein
VQPSFKGINFLTKTKLLKPIFKPIPTKLTKKVFDSLEEISTLQHEYYTKIRKEYVDFIKLHSTEPKTEAEKIKRMAGAAFRKRNGISDEVAKKITEDNLYYIPQKTLAGNFIHQVIAPIRAITNSVEKLITPKNSEKAKQIAIEEKIIKEFAGLQGLIKSHHIWENTYRKANGLPKWTKQSDFKIPKEVLLDKINRRRNKVVDPNKGKYSSTSMMLGNRLISGIIYSYFLGTDAYNTTMRYSNDKNEAAIQRKSRVAQEFSRIGMNMYIQNLLFGTFENAVNRSLSTAMFVSGSTVAFSEILGRKLVGKPIMPSDKKTLDRLEEEMSQKKGILPAIGRLLTNTKKKDATLKTPKISTQKTYAKTQPNNKTFADFAKKQNIKKPSFKGYYAVDQMFNKKTLNNIIKIVEQVDGKIANQWKKTIIKSLNNEKYSKLINENVAESFERLLNSQDIKELPIGTKKTTWGLWTSSFLVPVKFVEGLCKKTFKAVKNIHNIITNKVSTEKVAVKPQNKDKENIEGVKNILLWLEKQLSKENIELDTNGKLKEESANKVKKILLDSILHADSAKHVEYDGNTLAQTNINLSRAITTLFLMTDAYNLTMQYSDDNRKDAGKSAKNRAAQEISRISVSAYILAFVHNLLSKLCNSSLAGAFTLTAVTSTINDSISRKVVGVPLTAKTQEELQKIDVNNAKSKSPIRKALAYSIGKKTKISAPAQKTNSNVNDLECFKNDFFITPNIN